MTDIERYLAGKPLRRRFQATSPIGVQKSEEEQEEAIYYRPEPMEHSQMAMQRPLYHMSSAPIARGNAITYSRLTAIKRQRLSPM